MKANLPVKAVANWTALVLAWMALAAVIHILQLHIDRLCSTKLKQVQQVEVIPNYDVVKFFTGGYEQLCADCWWLAFVQYVGDFRNREIDHSPFAFQYLNLITQLDPRFTQPYWFAAFSVGADFGRPDLAAKIIDRGVEINQNDWYLPFIAGINQYLFARNDRAAARYYRMAAKYPDAPKWLLGQARILDAQIPSFIKSIMTWSRIYQSATDPMVKEAARQKLINMWGTVYRMAPDDASKDRAKAELRVLNVNAEEIEKINYGSAR